ncbi:hypothetical protein [Streptomyces sp. NPDC058603]|uniref:hypothetical protein n=1 Tax=Streptomyces sp. NPDC058603 TaxID=3346551 RepID=UPI003659BEE7
MPDDIPSLPERLLILADAFTRHNDALAGLYPIRTTSSAVLHPHVLAVQTLARSTLTAFDSVKSQPLYRSADVCDTQVRLRQLAFLTTAAADHLIDAGDIIDAARAENPDSDDPYHSYLHALMDAGAQIQMARDLTALAPETAALLAETLAAELHRQGRETPWLTAAQHTFLSPAQHGALRAIAQGQVTVSETAGKQYASSRDGRLPITTIRALESKDLLKRQDRPNSPGEQRLHLTAAGRQTLAAAATQPRPQPTALGTRPAPKPARATAIAARPSRH